MHGPVLQAERISSGLLSRWLHSQGEPNASSRSPTWLIGCAFPGTLAGSQMESRETVQAQRQLREPHGPRSAAANRAMQESKVLGCDWMLRGRPPTSEGPGLLLRRLGAGEGQGLRPLPRKTWLEALQLGCLRPSEGERKMEDSLPISSLSLCSSSK